MRIAIGCDHGGLTHKKEITAFLEKKGHEVTDFGTYTYDAVDYPDIAEKVCNAVVSGDCERGILVCGTGIGMSMAANKVKGIRAAACSDHFSCKYTRLHNDANVLCLGGRVIGVGTAIELAEIFVNTGFDGGERHVNRINKVMNLENK